MATKGRYDDESSDEHSSSHGDYSSGNDNDGEDLELPENLEDDSEDDSNDSSGDSNNVSTDEDDWRQETDISDVESETDDDDNNNDQGTSSIIPIVIDNRHQPLIHQNQVDSGVNLHRRNEKYLKQTFCDSK